MITAGIVIDDWKLPIFERRLKAAGYEFEQHPGVTSGTLLLKVQAESAAALQPVVEAANREARDQTLQ